MERKLVERFNAAIRRGTEISVQEMTGMLNKASLSNSSDAKDENSGTRNQLQVVPIQEFEVSKPDSDKMDLTVEHENDSPSSNTGKSF